MEGLDKISQKIDVIMDAFDELVDQALSSSQPDKVIFDIYNTFTRVKFKERKGTSSGFTGLIEFLYFQYIKKYLETKFDIIFESITSKKIYYFQAEFDSKKIILSSDIKLNHFKDKLSFLGDFLKKQPDIFIAIQKKDDLIPIAFIEIKASIISDKIIKKDIIDKFQELKEFFIKNQKKIPFFVFLDVLCKDTPPRNKIIEDFKNISDKCLLMRFINVKWVDGRCEGTFKGISISKILEKIISEIEIS